MSAGPVVTHALGVAAIARRTGLHMQEWEIGGHAGIAPSLGTCYASGMRVLSKNTLISFVLSRKKHHDYAALGSQIEAWYAEVRRARWFSMADIKKQFGNASVLSSDRAVFNIKGNDYRLIVAFDFMRQLAFVKWIGTHAEYDKINALTATPRQPADRWDRPTHAYRPRSAPASRLALGA